MDAVGEVAPVAVPVPEELLEEEVEPEPLLELELEPEPEPLLEEDEIWWGGGVSFREPDSFCWLVGR